MTLVLRATVTPIAGARREPIASGYRASLWFDARVRPSEGFAPVTHDAVLVWEPGGAARLHPFAPRELPRDLAPGRPFALLEGTRTVARGEVVALADDPAPSPLADLAAAGRRPLRERPQRPAPQEG